MPASPNHRSVGHRQPGQAVAIPGKAARRASSEASGSFENSPESPARRLQESLAARFAVPRTRRLAPASALIVVLALGTLAWAPLIGIGAVLLA